MMKNNHIKHSKLSFKDVVSRDEIFEKLHMGNRLENW